jgi:hypothetical protein
MGDGPKITRAVYAKLRNLHILKETPHQKKERKKRISVVVEGRRRRRSY